MKGFILAAGFGTRLRPITYTLPKPMVPLCNRPLIGWAVESFLYASVHELIVNLHHLPEPLQEFLRAEYAGRADFHFSIEEEILGTGGASSLDALERAYGEVAGTRRRALERPLARVDELRRTTPTPLRAVE